jgi:hypothetical protein
MTEAIRRSEEIRQSAVALLLEERAAIDEQLAKCGWEGEPPAPKKEKTCKKCGQSGHMAKTCTAEPTPV